MSDLAASGGAFLFIDSLDFFSEEERHTVVDLVRDAAKIRGISVIVTARQDFDADEPNWLPSDALDVLGRADPVLVGELSDDETGELREAAPQLAALLADGHPARAVARNLFRLSRLARRPSDAPLPRNLPVASARSRGLKTGFLVFCNDVPGLAAAYLVGLKSSSLSRIACVKKS